MSWAVGLGVVCWVGCGLLGWVWSVGLGVVCGSITTLELPGIILPSELTISSAK